MTFTLDSPQVVLAKAVADWCECVQKTVGPSIIGEFAMFGSTDDKTFARRVSCARQLYGSSAMPEEQRDAQLAMLDQFLRDPCGKDWGSQIGTFMSVGVRCVTMAVSMAWFNAVQVGMVDLAGQLTLRLDTLDDAMLPRADSKVETVLAKSLAGMADETVTPAEARLFLSAVRRGLPTGRVLPEEAEWLLEVNNVLIVR